MNGLKFYSKPKIKRPEAALQKVVIQHLILTGSDGVLFLSVPNERKCSIALGAEMKRMGLRPGAADLIVIVDGRVLFMEFKSAKGRQSPEQKEFEADAIAAGCAYVVANNINTALDALAEWGAIPIQNKRLSA